MKRKVGFNVYMPPRYPGGSVRYPVIYWLHGLRGDEANLNWDAVLDANDVEVFHACIAGADNPPGC